MRNRETGRHSNSKWLLWNNEDPIKYAHYYLYMISFNIAPIYISKLFQQNPGINPYNLTGARKHNIPSAKPTKKNFA